MKTSTILQKVRYSSSSATQLRLIAKKMHCTKCTHTVNAETDCFTVCKGSCYRAYHAHCVGLTEATISVFTKNVIWLCDDCLASFRAGRSSESNECTTVSVGSAPEMEIMKEINVLKDQIATVVTMLSGCHQSSTLVESSLQNKISTPISSPDSLNRTDESNAAEGNSVAGTNCSSSVSKSQQSFSLLLSNLDNRVTEQDIDLLVSNSLGMVDKENVNVTKLVPKWKSCEEMDYISFKVVLDNKWKSTAMKSSTWPQTIKYREFVNRNRNTWYPSG